MSERVHVLVTFVTLAGTPGVKAATLHGGDMAVAGPKAVGLDETDTVLSLVQVDDPTRLPAVFAAGQHHGDGPLGMGELDEEDLKRPREEDWDLQEA